MTRLHKCRIAFILLPIIAVSCNKPGKHLLKQPILNVLSVLDSALLSTQNLDIATADYGALWCDHCKLYHTRAAEAVFPFAYKFSVSKNIEYKDGAIRLGNWLIRQQFADGSWKETPEEWTGTTTDQLLMMAQAYPILKIYLTESENQKWLNSMRMAGDYLALTMTPEFASINYVATTTATLMVLNTVIPDEKYVAKAKELARKVVAKMDDDYFITGEGGRVFDAKYGVDLNYNMEMSLWGLALYAQLSGDNMVKKKVEKATSNHLHFIFPDGSLDGSWGIRSNKWTCFGGATSDGIQVLFSLLAEHDNRYRTAAFRNLRYLKTCMKDGFVGYGPQHWEVMADAPCIYPTFAKAKNLAMAHALLKKDTGVYPDLPSDLNGLNIFPTLNVANVRTDNFCTTITAYGYKDPKGSQSKYMYRPTGGAISNMWLKGYGFLQASSQTEYHRWEPMHFPDAKNLKCLTPRIEFQDSNGYFTNLFEFDATTKFSQNEDEIKANIYGELKNRDQEAGGIGYSYEYIFEEASVTKKVHIRFHSVRDTIRIIEPVILYKGTQISQTDTETVSITSKGKTILFELMEGKAILTSGEDATNYWSPYPALKAYPIVLTVLPREGVLEEDISYRFIIE